MLSTLSTGVPEGVVCMPLKEAMQVYGVFLKKRLTTLDDPTGTFLYVPPKVDAGTIDLTVPSSASLIVSIGKQGKARLMQSFELKEVVANCFLDISLDDGADLELKNKQLKAPGFEIFQKTRATLKRDSRFVFRQYLEGAKKARQEIQVELLGENAEAYLEGVTTLENDLTSEIYTFVRHLSPHARSRQHFKALLNHASKSSFDGTIYVHPTAQKTESYQLSNNLLLSDEAKAFVQPNLEIFADDVKASHGATVTQVDKEALFYLTSRGVSEEAARDFLVKGFVGELSECLP